jgi:class 3 adenylate cyclase
VALPLLLAAALIGAGLAAALLAAASSVASEQLALQSVADGAAASLEATLQTALSPLFTVRSFLADAPANALHSSARAYFAAAAPGLVASSPAIACLQLTPYGRLAAIYPLVSGSAADGTLLNLTTALGTIDLFNAAGSPNYRPAALLALASQELIVQGPQKVFACVGSQCSAYISPTLALIARVPIFVASSSANDTWADAQWPGASPGANPFGPFAAATNCSGVSNAASGGASLCATNALGDGRRFWGFATVLLSWQRLLALSRISALGDQRAQHWSVSRLPDSFPGGTGGATPINVAVVATTNDGNGALPATPFAAGVVAVARVRSAAFAISLQLSGGWQPSWVTPVIVVVVVLGLVVAGAFFVHLVERRLRFDLLFSMLPARVVKRLGSAPAAASAGASNARALAFAERFDHVTVIFTDIVRFTDLVATISPQETMAMLNSLFLEFDEITERAGVTKVETIGDAYMAVDGAADSPLRSPGEQALRMAALALEMVDAAGRHELPNGGQLRIRVGLHCGPVVAGVVGKTLPHWSLFGDTVNTAARMESTSVPGRVHVSSAFARLIFEAEAAARSAEAAALAAGRGPSAPPPSPPPSPPPFPLALQSRGGIAVKGKGVLATHFLLRRGDALLPGELASSEPSGTVAASSPAAGAGSDSFYRQTAQGTVAGLPPATGLASLRQLNALGVGAGGGASAGAGLGLGDGVGVGAGATASERELHSASSFSSNASAPDERATERLESVAGSSSGSSGGGSGGDRRGRGGSPLAEHSEAEVDEVDVVVR